jgi:hypothetical protein
LNLDGLYTDCKIPACYCSLYGICDLKDKVFEDVLDPRDAVKKGCDIDKCGDRWAQPPDFKLPDGWPKGWPEVGWHGELRTKEEIDRIRRRGRADMGSKWNTIG